MPTFRAISRTVNLTSPSMISFIFETISLRDANLAYLILVHFDGPYTRFNVFSSA